MKKLKMNLFEEEPIKKTAIKTNLNENNIVNRKVDYRSYGDAIQALMIKVKKEKTGVKVEILMKIIHEFMKVLKIQGDTITFNL